MLLRAVLLRIADDGHGTIDEQPPQVSIALLGDTAELVPATGRVLLRHQPDPGGQTTPGAKRLPVADLGNKGGGHDRPNTRNLLQPPARFT
jgi:hypothetical protein